MTTLNLLLVLSVLVVAGADPITAQSVCGDMLIQPGEACDDGNAMNGDGCTSLCQIERCGDGVTVGAEQCDDGNTFPGDGCYYCFTSICGDGVVSPGESCDDGNNNSGDGCSYYCTRENCMSDGECDNGVVCDGGEFCYFGGCEPGGNFVTCDDNIACTVDLCSQSGTCRYVATGDVETAPAFDARCQSPDDNLPLFGADGNCGGGDDLIGDGVCAGTDNCLHAHNPSQADADMDGAGNACDLTACGSPYAYVSAGGTLYRFDMGTGQFSQAGPSLPEMRDVWINPTETLAYMTSPTSGHVYQFFLTNQDPPIVIGASLSSPWGVLYDSSSNRHYVTENGSGELSYIGGMGMPVLVQGMLNQPRGLAVYAFNVVLVAEFGSGQLLQIDPFGMGSPVVKAMGLSGPSGVALDYSTGVAYVTEVTSGELSRVDLTSGVVTLVASGLTGLDDLALNASGTIAYVGGAGSTSLTAVDLATGVATPIPLGFSPVALQIGQTPPLSLNAQDGLQASPGPGYSVPITLDDVTGQGVVSADFTLQWNDAVLTATSVSPGGLAAGCSATSNLSTPGRAVISVFCTADLTGSGTLVTVTFNVIGTRGQGTPLVLSDGMLNEGSPALCLDSGSLEIPVTVDGRISYYRDSSTSSEPSTKRVAGATIEFTETAPGYATFGSAMSACDGTFSFGTIPPGRSYRLFPSRLGGFAGAIDPFDASLNAQHVVGLITLSANQRLAADVTRNGTLSSLDSAYIAQYSVGIIPRLPIGNHLGGDWAFVPAPGPEPNQQVTQPEPVLYVHGRIDYAPILESAENQDFLGILFGDVSGNWTPPVCLAGSDPGGEASLETVGTASAPAVAPAVHTARLIVPDVTTHPGGTVQVPVSVEGGAGALSFYLDLAWNPATLALRGVTAAAASAGFSLTTNGSEPGRARIALYSTAPLSADGGLVNLIFEVVGKAGSRTPVSLTTARINEGRIAAELVQGSVLVKPGRPKR